MPDGFSIDFSELNKLVADIAAVPKHVGKFTRAAVEVTARHVKDDWRAPLKGSASIPWGAASVTYDIKGDQSGGVSAEIGPELGGQGSIVGMLEYGTPTHGPTGYGHAALQNNVGDFQKGLEIALKDAERAAGL